MVLFCKLHDDLVVHCASLVKSRCPGYPEGGIVLNSPPFSIVRNIFFCVDKPNEFEGSKMMCEEVFFFSVPFRSKHFDAFWHFLSF